MKTGVHLMTSASGVATAEGAVARPVNLLMSGPVAGVVGGIWAGKQAGYDNVITLDVGGTSADIGLAQQGRLRMKHLLDTKVGPYQAMIPMVDVDTIGAGGGSIAYVDQGGIYRVGPRSAGADPGPAAYGRGGTEPTASDAMVNLGWLSPEAFLGGEMELRADLARTAYEEGPCAALDMSVEEASMGAVQILTHSMVQSIEENSVRKGYDPRDFALVAEGGAGPLFAAHIALEVGTPWVLVPPYPGITSAMGLLATDMVYEYVSTTYQRMSKLDGPALQGMLEDLERQARTQLEEDGVPGDRVLIQRVVDCRYLGQGYELRVDAPAGDVDEAWVEKVRSDFHDIHEREYSRRFEESDIEIPNVRVRGIGLMPELRMPEIEAGGESPSAALQHEGDAWFRVNGQLEKVATRYYDRSLLKAGNRLAGPAIVNQYDSTTVIPPGIAAQHRPVRKHRHRRRHVRGGEGNRRRGRDAGEVGDAMSVLEYELGRHPGPPERERVEVDPITLRVLGGAFHAIAKEMAGVLFRMSYSSIIRESEDLGAGIFDAEGRELCESDSTPMHIGSLPWYIRGFLHRLRGQIQRRRRHRPQPPVPRRLAHARHRRGGADLPRGRAARLRRGHRARARRRRLLPRHQRRRFDVYAEAKIYNGLRWYRRGELNEDLDRMIFDNVRTETMNRGDMNAMIAACQLGRERFLRLVQRYGVDVVMSAAYEWMDYSERMLRAEIEKIPDGEYVAPTGWLDDDARNRDVPLRVETKVIVEGDEITIDLTGSNPEVPTGYNVPVRGLAARRLLLRDPHDPARRGDVPGARAAERRRLPARQGDRAEGDDLQPELPACLLLALLPGAARGRQHHPRALRRAAGAGDRAGNSAGIHFCSYSGFLEESGEYWIYLEVNEGSYGGRHGKDAMDSVDNLMANTRNNPIEELDMRFPMRCEQYELRPGAPRPASGAAASASSAETAFSSTGCIRARATVTTTRHAASSAAGTASSRPVARTPTRRARRSLPAKVTGIPFASGEFIEFRSRTPRATAIPSSATPSWCVRTCSTTSRRSSWRGTPTASSSATSGRSRSTRTRRPRCARSSRPPRGSARSPITTTRRGCRATTRPRPSPATGSSSWDDRPRSEPPAAEAAGSASLTRAPPPGDRAGAGDGARAPGAQGVRAGRRPAARADHDRRALARASACRTRRCSRASSASAEPRFGRRCACSPPRT